MESIFSDQLNAAAFKLVFQDIPAKTKAELFYRLNSVCLYSPILVMETLITKHLAGGFSM